MRWNESLPIYLALSPLTFDRNGRNSIVDYRGERMPTSTDLLQGTLDVLILQTLAAGPMHGWGVAQRIQQVSRDVLQVGQGSLYPALHRLEYKGWICSEWDPRKTTAVPSITVDGSGTETARNGTGKLAAAFDSGGAGAGADSGGDGMMREGLSRIEFFLRQVVLGRWKREELDEELQFHLEQADKAKMAAGHDCG